MSDFSDKYKSAVEKVKISPDFKERTAKKMIELRDSESTEKRSKIKLYRGLSAVAAAAACIAAVFSLSQAGYFDGSSEPAVIVTDTTDEKPAQTAAKLPEEDSENTAEAVEDLHENTFIAEEEEIAVPDFTTAEADAENEENISKAAVQTEADVTSVTADTADNGAGATVRTVEAEKAVTAEVTNKAVTEAASAEESITEADSQTDEADLIAEEAEEESLPLGIAEYEPPSGEASEEDSEAVYDEGASENSDDSTTFDDSLNDEAVLFSEYATESFSANDAINDFRASSSYAVIIPAVSGYSEDGSIVSYSEREIKSVKELQALEKELCGCTEGKAASAVASIPADSSYIVDFADDQGNSLRIYIGSGYICFSLSDGSLYGCDISGDEYASLDSFIMSLIA